MQSARPRQQADSIGINIVVVSEKIDVAKDELESALRWLP
jgi:hypothetical protein